MTIDPAKSGAAASAGKTGRPDNPFESEATMVMAVIDTNISKRSEPSKRRSSRRLSRSDASYSKTITPIDSSGLTDSPQRIKEGNCRKPAKKSQKSSRGSLEVVVMNVDDYTLAPSFSAPLQSLTQTAVPVKSASKKTSIKKQAPARRVHFDAAMNDCMFYTPSSKEKLAKSNAWQDIAESRDQYSNEWRKEKPKYQEEMRMSFFKHHRISQKRLGASPRLDEIPSLPHSKYTTQAFTMICYALIQGEASVELYGEVLALHGYELCHRAVFRHDEFTLWINGRNQKVGVKCNGRTLVPWNEKAVKLICDTVYYLFAEYSKLDLTLQRSTTLASFLERGLNDAFETDAQSYLKLILDSKFLRNVTEQWVHETNMDNASATMLRSIAKSPWGPGGSPNAEGKQHASFTTTSKLTALPTKARTNVDNCKGLATTSNQTVAKGRSTGQHLNQVGDGLKPLSVLQEQGGRISTSFSTNAAKGRATTSGRTLTDGRPTGPPLDHAGDGLKIEKLDGPATTTRSTKAIEGRATASFHTCSKSRTSAQPPHQGGDTLKPPSMLRKHGGHDTKTHRTNADKGSASASSQPVGKSRLKGEHLNQGGQVSKAPSVIRKHAGRVATNCHRSTNVVKELASASSRAVAKRRPTLKQATSMSRIGQLPNHLFAPAADWGLVELTILGLVISALAAFVVALLTMFQV